MNKIEITDDIIDKVARAKFERVNKYGVYDMLPQYHKEIWMKGAITLIADLNWVVEILGLDNECKCGDHTTDDKLGYDCRVEH